MKHNPDYDLAAQGDISALTRVSGVKVGDISKALPDNYFDSLQKLLDKHVEIYIKQKSKLAYKYRLEILQRVLKTDRITLVNDIIKVLNEYGVKFTARYFGFPDNHRFTWIEKTGEKKPTGVAILTSYGLCIYIDSKTPDWIKKYEVMRPQFQVLLSKVTLAPVTLRKGLRISFTQSDKYHQY